MAKHVPTMNESIQEDQLPEIIRDEMAGLAAFKQKKDEAKLKAEQAKQLAERMQDPKFFKTNQAIKGVQDVARELADAQVLSAEAQEKSFEYQERITSASKYLFQLGVTNIAMNRSVVRELRSVLEGADPNELDDLAQKEIENVISQLLAQEDLINKQTKLADSIDAIEEEVFEHGKKITQYGSRISDGEKTSNKHGELINAGIEKDKEHDRLLKEGKEKDKEQDRLLAEKTRVDEEQSGFIEKQKEKDIEHDEKISNLTESIEMISERLKAFVPLKCYKIDMCILGSISVLALILAILALIFK